MKLSNGRILFLALLLSSCSPKIYNQPLVGKYQEAPTIITTSRSFNQVWDTIIDFFAQKGISISIIDKSSGLLIAKNKLTTGNWTYEENGKPQNPSAFIVVNHCRLIRGFDFKDFHPDVVESEWNVRVKTDGDKTLVNVNLFIAEVRGKPAIMDGFLEQNPCMYQAKSTGVFEKGLAEIFAGQ